MSQERQTQSKTQSRQIPLNTRIVNSYYGVLGLHPSASPLDIRRAYRDLSKQYHPDTTTLPSSEAIAKFQRLNEAYATLANPEQRMLYDLKIGYSRWYVIQAPPADVSADDHKWSNSAYLDPTDRPLSPGEISALLILGLTLVGCFALVMAIALWRGDPIVPSSAIPKNLSLMFSFFVKFL